MEKMNIRLLKLIQYWKGAKIFLKLSEDMPMYLLIKKYSLSLLYASYLDLHPNEVQLKIWKEIVAIDVPKWLNYFENLLKKNGTGYFVGTKVLN